VYGTGVYSVGVGPKGPALERLLDIKKKKIYGNQTDIFSLQFLIGFWAGFPLSEFSQEISIDLTWVLNNMFVIYSSYFCVRFLFSQGYCNLSNNVKSSLPGVIHATSLSNVVIPSESEQILRQDALLNSAKREEGALNTNPSDGRVMLIDGTSIMYRAYYRLLGISFYFLSWLISNDFIRTELELLSCFLCLLDWICGTCII
jgi:hypothetical protein